MPEVEILEARVIGEEVAVHGTVDGAGYRVTVPKAAVDAEVALAGKRRVCARALRDEWRRERQPAVPGVAGKVTLGDSD